FSMFLEMIWVRDLWGLVLKGMIFGLLAALFACHEGLRPLQGRGSSATAMAACRAACLAGVAILMVNSSWFLLFYHAGPAFGPTLLSPPGR
ncbi:MAG: ABC transporter permease, partial [Singulisphaera sp.]